MEHQFSWDEHNRAHIERHQLTPADVEPVFADPLRVRFEAYPKADEVRYGLIGAGVGRRLLAVVYVERHGAIRVVTARPASRRERAAYWEAES